MNTKQSRKLSLAEQRASFIFNRIAQTAHAAQALCSDAIAGIGGDDESAALTVVAAEQLCGLIGLLSDMGIESMGDIPVKGADPVAWFMPADYPREGESQ